MKPASPAVPDELMVVKLGGSLITDKRRPRTARREVIVRLAEEIAAARPAMSAALLVGHGSGSFGHVAAADAGLGKGPFSDPGRPAPERRRAGLSATQQQAAELHRRVVAALAAAGAAPFSWAPSTALVARAGRPVAGSVGTLVEALGLGMVPVVYGDVVTDRVWGASIASTEAVVRYLIGRLKQRGMAVRRVVWAGETAGIYDTLGRTVPEVGPENLRQVRRAVGASAGTDVTGGMRLRLDTAVALARRGVESWIIDGTVPGLLKMALTAEEMAEEVPGTRVGGWEG